MQAVIAQGTREPGLPGLSFSRGDVSAIRFTQALMRNGLPIALPTRRLNNRVRLGGVRVVGQFDGGRYPAARYPAAAACASPSD